MKLLSVLLLLVIGLSYTQAQTGWSRSNGAVYLTVTTDTVIIGPKGTDKSVGIWILGNVIHSGTTKPILWTDSTGQPGTVTGTMFAKDTTYRSNQIAADTTWRNKIIAADTTWRNKIIAADTTWRNVVVSADTTRRNNIIAADSLYRVNQTATKVSKADSGVYPGYVTYSNILRTPIYLTRAADTTIGARLTGGVIGGLEYDLAASTTYEFEASVQYVSSNAANGIVLIWAFPTSPTSFSSTFLVPVAANGTSAIYGAQQTATTDTVITTTVGSTSNVYTAIIKGKIVNGVNAGALRLWAKTSNGTLYNITVKAGSSMWIRRVS